MRIGRARYSHSVTSLVLARRPAVPAAYAAMVGPAIVYIALFGAVGAWYPYQSVFLASRGLDLATIGLLLALFGVVSLVAAPVWGAIADRMGVISRPLVAASLVAAAGAAWLAVANELSSIAAAVALMSLGVAGMIPLTDTRTVELAGSNRERYARARAFGSASFIGGAVVTGAIVSGRSPDALFVLFVPLLAMTGVAAWRLLGPGRSPAGVEHRPRARPSIAGFVRVLGRPGLLALLVGSTIIWTAVGAVMSFIGIRVAGMGADLGIIGLISAVGAVIEIPIMFAFPRLARRFGAERLLVLGTFAFAVRAAGWALAPSPLVVLLVAPFGGIGFALFYVGIVGFVAKSVPAEAQATAQGVYTGMTFSLGTVVGAALAGVAAPALGLPGLFAAAAVATVVGAFTVARAVSVARRQSAPGEARA
jgi:PPP family 3-phenylpropionic acid transporter